jgi:hypothetical protein
MNFKKIYVISMFISLFGMNLNAQVKADKFGMKYTKEQSMLHNEYNKSKAYAPTAEELLGCPDGTVLGGEYHEGDGVSTGFQSSDQGRTDHSTKFYQHFDECFYKVNGVRFIGLFNYWDTTQYNWFACDSRGEINENGEMTKPVRFEVSFYKDGEDGYPGEKVYSKEFDLIGEKTGVQNGDESSGYSNIYAFTADLGEEVKLETGYVSVSAVNMGDSPSCWFSLFTSSTSIGYGLVQWDGTDWMSAFCPMCFCLKGPGDYSAKKALKLCRVMTPTTSSDGMYERVQVELQNAGSEPINDAKLELWADGKLVATENVDATIGSLDFYKYTFNARVNCSEIGEHKFEVRNATPNDEKLCAQALTFSTEKAQPGAYGESKSETCDYNYFTYVKVGDIENNSEATNYSDFTNLKTTILPNDTLDLRFRTTAERATVAMWVDWNGNGSFSDKGEQLYFKDDSTAMVYIPNDITVLPGDKRLRIVCSYETPKPVGDYSYGETEDYTIVVARKDGAPAVNTNVGMIDVTTTNGKVTSPFDVSNEGTQTLEGKVTYNYVLPDYPGSVYSTSNAKPNNMKLNIIRKAISNTKSAPADDAQTQYTLRYDKGQFSLIAITNSDTATFAQMYPGKMLESIKGMKVSSVDVYLGDLATKSKIVIYGEKSQNENGTELTSQEFTPVKNSWNHIVLNNPLTIDGKDIWVALQLIGFAKNKLYVGIDNGDAVRSFGDIVKIGAPEGPKWWSMGDLGVDNNYCIRANVTGERTPAISWMSMDKQNLNIAGGSKDTYTATMNAGKLSKNLYEGFIEIQSNDALRSNVRIPVYLNNGVVSGIINDDMLSSVISFDNSAIAVKASKSIEGITLADVAGHIFKDMKAPSRDTRINVSSLATGIYVLTLRYADGGKDTIKLPIMR